MGLIAYCKLQCDHCRAIFEPDAPAMDNPRRQRARARRAGWQRLRVKTGEHIGNEWGDVGGKYQRTGRLMVFDQSANRDFCPACLRSETAYALPEPPRPVGQMGI